MKLMPASSALADQALGVGLLQLADLPQMPVAAAEGHGAEAELGDEKAGAAEGLVRIKNTPCVEAAEHRRLRPIVLAAAHRILGAVRNVMAW